MDTEILMNSKKDVYMEKDVDTKKKLCRIKPLQKLFITSSFM